MSDHFPGQPLGLPRRAFLATAATGGALAGLTTLVAATAADAAGDVAAADPLGIPTDAIDIAALPRVQQTLIAPPLLPEHEQIASTGPKIVEVTMNIIEKKTEIDDDGTTIWAFTYEGTVPGPMIVCH